MLQTKEKQAYIKRTYAFICAFIIFTVTLFPSADAGPAWKKFPQAMSDQINSGATDIVLNFFLGSADNASDNTSSTSAMNKTGFTSEKGHSTLYEWVSSDSTANGRRSFKDVFGPFMNGCAVIAFGIALVLALWRYWQRTDQGADPVEQFFKFLIEIMIVGIFMLKLSDLIGFIAQLGGALIDQIRTSIDTDRDKIPILYYLGFTKKKDDTDVSLGGLKWLRAICILFIPWLFSWVLTIAAYLVSFSILIEIALRRLFMPLAVADIYGEGKSSPGAKYIKKYFAVFLKIVVCLAICIIMAQLNNQLIVDLSQDSSLGVVLGCVMMTLALNFTAVRMMLRGGEYVNDIVGA